MAHRRTRGGQQLHSSNDVRELKAPTARVRRRCRVQPALGAVLEHGAERRGVQGSRGDGVGAYPEWRQLDGEVADQRLAQRSEEHTSELQSLMRNSYAVFCLKKKKTKKYKIKEIREKQKYKKKKIQKENNKNI